MNDPVFDCPECGQLLEATADMAGLMVECPRCGSVIEVPAAGAPGSGGKRPATPPVRTEADEEERKRSTIRIELPPNLGVPEAPRRRITIRRR